MSTAQDSTRPDVSADSESEQASKASDPVPADTDAAEEQSIPSPEAGEDETEELRAQLDQALAEVEEHKEQFLRARAEVENTRRRATNDVSNAHKYAVEKFAAEMLAVKDSLELARAVELKGDNHAAMDNMLEGLDLTLKLMDSAFQKFSLQVIDPGKGEKFDPEIHQAMTMQDSDEVAPNHVLSVVQKGYQLHQRLLRPAMVVIAKAKGSDSAGERSCKNPE